MGQSPILNLDGLIQDLDTAGLNLCHVFSADYLAESMPELMLPVGCRQLLLIGNSGNAMWQAMPVAYLERENPVDSYTVDTLNGVLDQQIPDHWQTLFPKVASDDLPMENAEPSLQSLGAFAGWHHPSPLGIGINQYAGLWFAYRAVVSISTGVQRTSPMQQWPVESPCVSCAVNLCVSSCPAQAVTYGEPPDLQKCVDHRVADQSSCAATCLARVACPVTPQWRYEKGQMQYFYKRSLLSLQQWVSNDSNR